MYFQFHLHFNDFADAFMEGGFDTSPKAIPGFNDLPDKWSR